MDLFARLASLLTVHGAPFDCISAAARSQSDELRHAHIMLSMCEALSGRQVEVSFDRSRLVDPWRREPDTELLDAAMLEICALGETQASAQHGANLAMAEDPVARAVFRGVFADEVNHARLGWYFLSWRAPQWTRAERQHVADLAAVLVMDVERRHWRGRDAPRGAKRAARALGVLGSEDLRAAIRDAMEREIVPGLDALGLGASHAWAARRRGG